MARKDWSNAGHRLADDPSYKELCEIQTRLKNGELDQLEFASQVVDGFPLERDSCYGSPWIVHAVSSGSLQSVKWMIEKGVNLQPICTDGYPPVIRCIEVEGPEKYQILSLLIDAGADINERGINGWTPLHVAAVRDDEASMRILLEGGADRTITTKIDDDATAEEEARNLGHRKSADFIAGFGS
ncbi:ankyrin repeat domain-containing protein [Tateyamaria sp. ANG-S1]|uniref:ankyrin repeat domain-containing protein n=1 Tax=Tateyamaria sp. ANG-S1 TaxID=1577905 RepID=UPI001F4CC142|nr:ankyrin repeat domain-containing protein [Tateyamaria sp. ANG-S1]